MPRERGPWRPIPENTAPRGTRCIMVDIPDDDGWERAMWDELKGLTIWNFWERDAGKNGKPVADRWLRALSSWRHCDGSPSPVHGTEIEDFMPLRIDCDCNVFVTCCDGTEKQILTSQQVKDLINGSGPGTSPQPSPGGGCETYSGKVTGLGTWPIPTPVSDGDTITISSGQGASGNSSTRWNCSNGNWFWAGACVPGTPYFDASARVPSAPVGAMVVKISGTWYDASAPITVPGGVSNAQAVVGLNYNEADAQDGDVTFNVQVCNNAPTAWCYIMDFAVNNFGFVCFDDGAGVCGGTWNAGTGWTSTARGDDAANYIDIKRVGLPAVAYTNYRIKYNIPSTVITGVGYIEFFSGGSSIHNEPLDVSAGAHDVSGAVSLSGVDRLEILIELNIPTADAHPSTLMYFEVRGMGTNPFGADNC